MKKVVTGIMLTMLIVSTLTLVFNIQTTRAEFVPEVYLIDINGVGTWWSYVDSTSIAQAAKALFEANGYRVEIVNDLVSLNFLVNNPPDNVIVINTHGEIMPMPPSWPNWDTYFVKLGNNVKDHGWIFVSTVGYPFFYYDQGSGMVAVGGSGVNTFLSVVEGLEVACKIVMHWDPLYGAYLTETGEKAASRMGISLPSRIITVRPARWSVDPDYVFYMQFDDPWAQEGFKYGASAVSMGNGFFLLNGFGGRNVDLPPGVPPYTNQTIGEAAAAFSAYILSKKLGKPPVIIPTVDINPDTLNLRSGGKWIMAYIELSEGYDVNEINVSSVMLNDSIQAEFSRIAIGDYDNDTIPDLMVKFDRAKVISYIMANVDITKLFEERFTTITLTITGCLKDGTSFRGSKTIRIIMQTPRCWRFIKTTGNTPNMKQ